MGYFDGYPELSDAQRDELHGLMAIHESAGMRPWDAAKQALRDRIRQARVGFMVIEAARDKHKANRINAQANEAATSPLNDLTTPTGPQAETNSYRHGHVKLHGFSISIENPKGSSRKGVDPGGRPWKVTMPAHYGYIKGTVGADKDHVDVYIGDHPESDMVFVVDQLNLGSGEFDEHKVILGCKDMSQAKKVYCAGFSDGKGPERIGAITELMVELFKSWSKSPATKEPMSAAVFVSGKKLAGT